MNRGIIILSSAEQSYLASLLQNNPGNSGLQNRLMLPLGDNSGLQISEEEANILLDSLPRPTPDQSDIAISCRNKLNGILASFRQ